MSDANRPTSETPADGGDARLDRAIDALRDAPVPDGPSPELIARTQQALREARAQELRAARLRPFHRAVRVAAAVALLASAVGVYLVATRGRDTVVTPVTQPSPTTPVVPGPAVVQKDDGAPRTPGVKEPATPHDTVAQGTTGAKDPGGANEPVVAMGSPVGISGTVVFAGPAPQPKQIDMSAVQTCKDRHPNGAIDDSLMINKGRLANVVVSIEPVVGQDLPAMAATAAFEELVPLVLDQRNCQFQPRIIAGLVGQELVVKNSDPFLHNVHSKANLNPAFNIGQPNVDEFGRRLDPLAAPERFQVKCDLHPWMTAYVSVFEHPYFAVTGADGSFTIPARGLADGAYSLLAWHETLGERHARVVVKDGHAVEMTEFKFEPGAAAVAPASGAPTTSTVQACTNCPK